MNINFRLYPAVLSVLFACALSSFWRWLLH